VSTTPCSVSTEHKFTLAGFYVRAKLFSVEAPSPLAQQERGNDVEDRSASLPNVIAEVASLDEQEAPARCLVSAWLWHDPSGQIGW
jgi:hypothetical protein